MAGFPVLTGPEIPKEHPDTIIILLHGYGLTGESIFRKLSAPLAQAFPNALILAPNAPYPCKEFPAGYDWIRFDGDWNQEAIIRKLCDAEQFLNHFLDELLARYQLPDNRLILAGFSQGARLALHLALRRERPCGAVLAYSGGLSQPQLLAKEIRSTPPVCLIHGDKDDILHIDQHHNSVKILSMLNVPVTEYIIPELRHRIDTQGIRSGIEFLQRVSKL